MSYNFLQWLLESWIALARYHIIVSRFKIRKEKLNDSKKGEFIPESHHANHSLGNHQLWKWNRVIINTVRQMANLLQFCWIENWVMYFCICIFVYLYLCHDQYSLEDGQFVASVLDRKLGHVHWPESEKLSRFRLTRLEDP